MSRWLNVMIALVMIAYIAAHQYHGTRPGRLFQVIMLGWVAWCLWRAYRPWPWPKHRTSSDRDGPPTSSSE